jgi:hypothetical protein
MAAVRGANTPVMHVALDALACLLADDDNKDNSSSVGGQGEGKGFGQGGGIGMIIDPQSVCAAFEKDG